MRNNFISLGISLTLLGVFFLLRFLEIINTPFSEISSIIFIMYGIVTVYFSFDTGHRGSLFFSSSIFLTGVLIYITNNYEILNPSSTIFASILFITGSSTLMLFIDNIKEKTFLYVGVMLWLISLISITYLKNNSVIILANKLSNTIMDYWPVFILLFGINILIMRKR